MSKDALTTYLNDHLAGSVGALNLLERLVAVFQTTERGRELAELRTELQEDREVLLQLLHDVGGRESRLREGAAFLSEKLVEAKLQAEDPAGLLFIFEALETVGLGIEGKLSLWRALQAATSSVPQARELDYRVLERRAMEQFARVDKLRLALAPQALSVLEA